MEYIHHIERHIDVVVEIIELQISTTFESSIDNKFI